MNSLKECYSVWLAPSLSLEADWTADFTIPLNECRKYFDIINRFDLHIGVHDPSKPTIKLEKKTLLDKSLERFSLKYPKIKPSDEIIGYIHPGIMHYLTTYPIRNSKYLVLTKANYETYREAAIWHLAEHYFFKRHAHPVWNWKKMLHKRYVKDGDLSYKALYDLESIFD